MRRLGIEWTAALVALSMGTAAAREVFDFQPRLSASSVEARIRLADKRLQQYPLDDLNFVMMDLEHPKTKLRQAHQCTGDLTGRTIEFMAEARQVVPGLDNRRVNELFERILVAGPNAAFGRRLFPYYRLTGNSEALRTIRGILDGLIEESERLGKDRLMESVGLRDPWFTIIEGLADMYELTGETKYVELAKVDFPVAMKKAGDHSHGHMHVLRAMLKMAKVTGDGWFLDQVKPHYDKLIADQHADGSISECLPRSYRNEGCSIADWLILNLRYFDLTGDSAALDRAEHVLYNALFFNQFVSGAFGHRNFVRNGYGSDVEEAWWCCTQTAGMALCDTARHAVQLIDGAIRVNFFVPGTYTLVRDGRELKVEITTDYPAAFTANVRVIGDEDVKVSFRIPPCVKDAKVVERKMTSLPNARSFNLTGAMGHYAEKRDGAWVMKYGPLMLAPMSYSWEQHGDAGQDAPEGYVPETVDDHELSLLEPKELDAHGFWKVKTGLDVVPTWPGFDDGAGSRTGTYFKAPAKITVCDKSGKTRELYMQPLCYSTSAISLRYVPITFGLMRAKK